MMAQQSWLFELFGLYHLLLSVIAIYAIIWGIWCNACYLHRNTTESMSMERSCNRASR